MELLTSIDRTYINNQKAIVRYDNLILEQKVLNSYQYCQSKLDYEKLEFLSPLEKYIDIAKIISSSFKIILYINGKKQRISFVSFPMGFD